MIVVVEPRQAFLKYGDDLNASPKLFFFKAKDAYLISLT